MSDHRRRLIIASAVLISCVAISFQFSRGQGIGERFGQRPVETQDAQTGDYSTETIQVGDTTRTYLFHTPPSNKKKTQLPLVLILHGGSTPAERMVNYTRMNAIADRESFIIVYPRGTNNFWNDGRERAPKVDDVGFIRALIAHLEKTLPIDQRRIYAAGISNGGMMTQRLACELSDKIAAIASLAASMPENYSPQCRPTATISVLLIHGTDDPLVPYRGGPLSAASNIGGSIWPLTDTIKYWAARDKCTGRPKIDYLPDRDPNDRAVTRREIYRSCANGTDVILLTVEGGGHTWPGANPYLPESRTGRTTKDFDGSEVIWDFFKQQSKK
jgi:polyhydroxybutyrate depolymerase